METPTLPRRSTPLDALEMKRLLPGVGYDQTNLYLEFVVSVKCMIIRLITTIIQ